MNNERNWTSYIYVYVLKFLPELAPPFPVNTMATIVGWKNVTFLPSNNNLRGILYQAEG
jgi:hypothetical protein